MEELIGHIDHDVAGVIGFVDYEGKNLYNAVAVFVKNRLVGVAYKTLLPTMMFSMRIGTSSVLKKSKSDPYL